MRLVESPHRLPLKRVERHIFAFFAPWSGWILLDGGHMACPLCQYSADLGFAVTVVDNRPSFPNRQRFPEAQTVICDTFPNALRSIRVNEPDYAAVITRGHRRGRGNGLWRTDESADCRCRRLTCPLTVTGGGRLGGKRGCQNIIWRPRKK